MSQTQPIQLSLSLFQVPEKPTEGEISLIASMLPELLALAQQLDDSDTL